MSAASLVTVGSGAKLALAGNGQIASTNILIQPGGLFDATAAPFFLAAGQTLSAGRSSSPATDLSGNITLSGGVLDIGSGTGTIATLTAANGTLALSSGIVNFDLTNQATSVGGTNDVVAVANLAITGSTTLAINATTRALGNGTYPLFNFGTLSGGTSSLIVDYTNLVANGTRQNFSLVTTGTSNASVELVVGGTPANLVWSGSAGSAWDLIKTVNWNNTTPGTGTGQFYNNDVVTFNDTGKTGGVSLAGSLSPSSVIFNNSSLTYTLSGAGSITGPTGLTKNGSGTVVLANSNGNQYTGATAINAGQLLLGAANAVQNSTVSVNVDNGLGFVPGAGPFNVGALSGAGALALSDSSGGAPLLNVGGNGANATYSGVISGAGGLTKSGAGMLLLTAANTYRGGTTLAAGAVQLGNANAVQYSTVTVKTDNGLLFSPDIGTFNLGGLAGGNVLGTLDTSSSAVTLSVGGNGQNTTFNGTLSGAGALVKTGTGTLTLTGTNIGYTGNTTVNAGTLQLQDTVAFTAQYVPATGFSVGGGPANTFNVARGATLEFNVNGGVNPAAPASDGARTALGTFGGTTISGQGTLLKTGTGALALGGQGDTKGGKNQIVNVSMAAGSLIDIENGALRNGGFAAAYWTNNQASMYIGPNGALDVWDGNQVNIDALNGSGAVTKGQGGNNNVSLNVGVAGGSGSFSGVIQNPQTQTNGNSIAGSSISLIKSGAGVQVLTGSNTYTGPTTVNGGTLQVGNGGSGASIGNTGGVTLANNSALVFNHADNVTFGCLDRRQWQRHEDGAGHPDPLGHQQLRRPDFRQPRRAENGGAR